MSMNTPIGSIYTTTSIKNFKTLTGLTPEQFLLGIEDLEIGHGVKITLANLIASLVSSDAGNLLSVGTDEKLKVEASDVSFDDLTDTAKVVYGSSNYGGSESTNLDSIAKSGFYTCAGSATGSPSGSYSWFVVHQNSNVDATSATQRAVAFNSIPVAYERVKTSGLWGVWVLQSASSGGGGVVVFDPLGTVTTDQTLASNKITTGHWSGSNVVSLPTLTDTANQVECIMDFTTATTSSPSINQYKALTGTISVTNGSANVTGTGTAFASEIKVNDKILIASVEYTVSSVTSNTALVLTANYAGTTASGLSTSRKFVRWSSANQGKAPNVYPTLTGLRSKIEFKSIWESGLLYWEAEYKSYGGIEVPFVRPNMTADVTPGGANFATFVSGYYQSQFGYLMCDGSLTTFWEANTPFSPGPCFFGVYNPEPIKVDYFLVLNHSSLGANYVIAGGSVYGSNDGTYYTFLNNFTNSVTANGATWPIPVSNGGNFYKYLKIVVTSMNGIYQPIIMDLLPVAVKMTF